MKELKGWKEISVLVEQLNGYLNGFGMFGPGFKVKGARWNKRFKIFDPEIDPTKPGDEEQASKEIVEFEEAWKAFILGIAKAFGPPLNKTKIQSLLAEYSPIFVSSEGADDFIGHLFLALRYLKKGRVSKCKQCGQFIAARGNLRRFCSDSCRVKAYDIKHERYPYNPDRKIYFRLYHRYVTYQGMNSDEFRNQYQQLLEKELEKEKSKPKKGGKHAKD